MSAPSPTPEAPLPHRQVVGVVGMGGLGCPIAVTLADAGVDLVLIDEDRVELSNLQRQVLYATTDLGRDKLEVARERLGERYPGLRVELRPGRLTHANRDALLAGADLAIDASDDPEVRFLVNAWGLDHRRPVVIGGVHRFDGLVFAHAGRGPCFRCLFEEAGPEVETCAQGGVIGALAGYVGHLQAERALALLAGDARAAGFVTTLDALRGKVRHLRLERAPDCPACAPPEPRSP